MIDALLRALCRLSHHKWVEMAEGTPRHECQYCNSIKEEQP